MLEEVEPGWTVTRTEGPTLISAPPDHPSSKNTIRQSTGRRAAT